MSQSGGAQFTPGPWVTFGPIKCQIYGGDPVKRIAVLDYTTGSETEEHIGNAHLIATAPAMYEALRMLIALDPRCHRGVTHCGECGACLGKAALAQAEGRQG